MAGRWKALHGMLAGGATLWVKLARRLGVPFERFERHGWLPIPLHFYYPYARQSELEAAGYWSSEDGLDGVELDASRCIELLREIGRSYGAECDWPRSAADPHTYCWDNGTFGFTSAAVAHAMLRHVRPQRVIEVGSGYSTHILAGALQRNAADGERPARMTIVEPHPAEILNTEIPHLERRLHEPVERVDLSLFAGLGRDDVLFIDSSHVLRYGGDVAFLYLRVLPALAPGVVVHIHDIHLPEPYPRVYFEQSRYTWNEQQLLQAFLSLNRDFEILLPCWLLHRRHDGVFREAFPHYDPARHRPGSSFWLRRREAAC